MNRGNEITWSPSGNHTNDDDISLDTHSAHAHGTHNQSKNQVATMRLDLEQRYKIQEISHDAVVGNRTQSRPTGGLTIEAHFKDASIMSSMVG